MTWDQLVKSPKVHDLVKEIQAEFDKKSKDHKLKITTDMLRTSKLKGVRRAIKQVRARYYPEDPEARDSYFKTEREVGSGLIRIGKTLQVREDMYQLLTISNFRHDLLQEQFKEYELQT